jgi:DNA polymerase-3 subunit epsilon
MYAIIDIETTGGSPASEKITEIAVFIHNGSSVVEEFSTLINPEKKIPYFITNLTGITNKMVARAPKFYEVARKIIELTRDKIFIAHNAAFDYNFVRNEFKRLGYNYSRDKLCTVQLSRKLVPGLPSYSLGNLCKQLGIEINGRHRAAGDAFATVKLFEYLLQISDPAMREIEKIPGLNKKDLHPDLDPGVFDSLPEKTGVYYFYNDRHDLIYIGKSRNIHNRVLTHFRNYSSRKAIEMHNAVAEISYEITGSEIIALLKESHEIKQYKPIYNRSQRRVSSPFGIFHFIDTNGYIRFSTDKNSAKSEPPLCSFSTQKSAKIFLQQLTDNYGLCQKLCGLYSSSAVCFHYEIMECRGACIGKESPENYNIRAQQVVDIHKYNHNNFFILDSGRNSDEFAAVLIENMKYIGYGYLDRNFYNGEPETLNACIHSYDDNRDVQQILRNFLIHNTNVQLIPFTRDL